jgi:uncharacterized protein
VARSRPEQEFIPYTRWTWLLGRPLLWTPWVLVPAAAALPGGSVLLYAHYVAPNRIHTREVTLPLRGAPRSFRSSLIQLSDLHLVREGRWSRRLVAAVQRARPERFPLGVITGDFVWRGMRRSEVLAALRQLPRPAGGWVAVPGGWEHSCGISGSRFGPFCAEAGIHALINETLQVELDGQAVNLVGLDDPESGKPDLQRALRGADPDLPIVVLCHQPDTFDRVAGQVDLVLAGHSHGGQVRLPGRGPLWLPTGCRRYHDGVHERDGSTLFVSRGLGTTVAPVRLFSRPEVAVIRLQGTGPGAS